MALRREPDHPVPNLGRPANDGLAASERADPVEGVRSETRVDGHDVDEDVHRGERSRMVESWGGQTQTARDVLSGPSERPAIPDDPEPVGPRDRRSGTLLVRSGTPSLACPITASWSGRSAQ